MQHTEAQILATTFDRTRGYSRWYTSKLKDFDPTRIFQTTEGTPLNSLYWLNAHLAWAEDFLILGGTHGKRLGIDWLERFGIDTNPAQAAGPSFKEVLDTQKMVHEAAMAHFKSISDEMLNSTNAYNFTFGGNNDVRGVLIHAIAHEGVHAGHMSWLCKMYGVETV